MIDLLLLLRISVKYGREWGSAIKFSAKSKCMSNGSCPDVGFRLFLLHNLGRKCTEACLRGQETVLTRLEDEHVCTSMQAYQMQMGLCGELCVMRILETKCRYWKNKVKIHVHYKV